MAFHPDTTTLRLFAACRLDEGREAEIERHLAECPECRERLAEIEHGDKSSILQEMQAAMLREPASSDGIEKIPKSETGGFSSGDLIRGHYRLEEPLGRGGMGVAWKAFDETARRHVVLKFVPKEVQNIAEAMNSVRESFDRVHALQHQHICPLYGLFEDQEAGLFLVMKFVDGQTLGDYRRQHAPLPFNDIVQILRAMAEALDYPHARKVIHRDIKPQNVMVGRIDGVQIIDFGLADEIRSSMERITGHVATKISGTRPYMAPEQWQGKQQDARTDQYALAATAYELFAGHVPFSGPDAEVLKNCVLHDLPAPIADLPKHVNTALLKGLAKIREDRFDHCTAFIDALAGDLATARNLERKRLAPVLRISTIVIFVFVAFFVLQHYLWKFVEDAKNTEVPGITDIKFARNDEGIKIISPPVKPNNLPTKEDFNLSKYLAIERNQRTGLRNVMRVAILIDENGFGRFLVNRVLSSEPLGVFKGTRFDSKVFRDVMAFHGDNHAVRYLFLKGNMALSDMGAPFTQPPPPRGWEYQYFGGTYDSSSEKTRFSLQGSENRAGFVIGKQGSGLPCAVTYEILDNKDDPPQFEMTFYKNYKNKNIACTLTCCGLKGKYGRVQMSATCSRQSYCSFYTSLAFHN